MQDALLHKRLRLLGSTSNPEPEWRLLDQGTDCRIKISAINGRPAIIPKENLQGKSGELAITQQVRTTLARLAL